MGANPNPQVEGFQPLETHVSYFKGQDASQWHASVPVWGGVRYVDLYPGIDLEITSSGEQWAWQLVVHDNGAQQLGNVVLRVEGAQSLGLDLVSQAVLIDTAVGNLSLPLLPVIGADGVNLGSPSIDGDEVIAPFASPATLRSASALAAPARHTHDASRRLLIGPLDCSGCDLSQLQYSTFLGGTAGDTGQSVVVDAGGAAYVAGYTVSSDFTYTVGYTQTWHGASDVFVAKLNSAGSSPIYITYLGGAYDDLAHGIAIDSNQAAYIVGYSRSNDYPLVNALQTVFTGTVGQDTVPIVSKLDPNGTSLAYSTYLGTGNGESIAVRPGVNNVVYVTGGATTRGFPTTSNAFTTT